MQHNLPFWSAGRLGKKIIYGGREGKPNNYFESSYKSSPSVLLVKLNITVPEAEAGAIYNNNA